MTFNCSTNTLRITLCFETLVMSWLLLEATKRFVEFLAEVRQGNQNGWDRKVQEDCWRKKQTCCLNLFFQRKIGLKNGQNETNCHLMWHWSRDVIWPTTRSLSLAKCNHLESRGRSNTINQNSLNNNEQDMTEHTVAWQQLERWWQVTVVWVHFMSSFTKINKMSLLKKLNIYDWWPSLETNIPVVSNAVQNCDEKWYQQLKTRVSYTYTKKIVFKTQTSIGMFLLLKLLAK